jgi:hypothetical protein
VIYTAREKIDGTPKASDFTLDNQVSIGLVACSDVLVVIGIGLESIFRPVFQTQSIAKRIN